MSNITESVVYRYHIYSVYYTPSCADSESTGTGADEEGDGTRGLPGKTGEGSHLGPGNRAQGRWCRAGLYPPPYQLHVGRRNVLDAL